MSKTILGNLLARFGDAIARLFGGIHNAVEDIDDNIKGYAEKALQVTTAIKNALHSPYAEIILDIIPGDWDELTRNTISATLDIINGWLSIDLKDMHPEAQDAMLIAIASKITADLDGNKLFKSQYNYITQSVYSAKVAENKAW